ncbi:MAG: hypothetical protein QXD77_00900 [Candidatus Aenigmatarchaeota archaeon]
MMNYVPQRHRMSEEEAQARLYGRLPRRRPSNSEIRARNAIYSDLKEGEECAERGELVMANIIYQTNRHKIKRMEHNTDLKRALDRLKAKMDEKRAELQQEPKIEYITIKCEHVEPSEERNEAALEKPDIWPDEEPKEDEDKPEYDDWTEARKACGYR